MVGDDITLERPSVQVGALTPKAGAACVLSPGPGDVRSLINTDPRSQQGKQMPASQGHALSAEERHRVSTMLEGEDEI